MLTHPDAGRPLFLNRHEAILVGVDPVERVAGPGPNVRNGYGCSGVRGMAPPLSGTAMSAPGIPAITANLLSIHVTADRELVAAERSVPILVELLEPRGHPLVPTGLHTRESFLRADQPVTIGIDRRETHHAVLDEFRATDTAIAVDVPAYIPIRSVCGLCQGHSPGQRGQGGNGRQ